MVQFRLVPFAPSSPNWKAYGSTYGKVPSKRQTIFGYKLHLLIAMDGVILDFELAPANECDWEVGFELLSAHTDLQVLGDKACISAEKAAHLCVATQPHPTYHDPSTKPTETIAAPLTSSLQLDPPDD